MVRVRAHGTHVLLALESGSSHSQAHGQGAVGCSCYTCDPNSELQGPQSASQKLNTLFFLVKNKRCLCIGAQVTRGSVCTVRNLVLPAGHLIPARE